MKNVIKPHQFYKDKHNKRRYSMNRETRKANLRKLQLPGSGVGSRNSRKPKNIAATSSISNYFTTPNKLENKAKSSEEDNTIEKANEMPAIAPTKNITTTPNKSKTQNNKNINENENEPQASTSSAVVVAAAVNTETTKNLAHAKRTKLTAFVYKDVPPPPATAARKEPSADDFEIPPEKIKKAPKIKATSAATAKSKKPRPKRQQNIKSAFLRNEQIFSEITAQHCLAENFSPDDMQLALAISKSETETSILCPSANEDVVDLVVDKAVASKDGDAAQDSIRNKLQKYGFRTAAREDYNTIAAAFMPGANNRRNKSKWAKKFTALTLRNPEYQMKKVNERIDAFLGTQCTTKPLTESQSHIGEYLINSTTVKKYKISETDKIVCKDEHKDSVNLDEYFVKDLFEVSHVNAGHLLKNWGAIQGRDLSPQQKSSRRLLLEQKLQNVYAELEQYFNQCIQLDEAAVVEKSSVAAFVNTNCKPIQNFGKPSSDDASLSASSSIKSHQNSIANSSTNCNELDKLLELIADISDCNSSQKTLANEDDEMPASGCTTNSVLELVSSSCTSPTKEPPDMKLKLNTSSIVEVELQTDVSLSANYTTDATLTQRTCGGTTSPDLFADSDVEMDNAEIAIATQSVHGISTYEIYSSDEAPMKNSNIYENIVDLTQEEPEASSIDSSACKMPNSSQRTLLLDYSINSQQSKYIDNEGNSALYSATCEDHAKHFNLSASLVNADFNWNQNMMPNTSIMCPSISDNTFKELSNKYLKPIESVVNGKRKSISMTQLNKLPVVKRRSLNKSFSFTQPFNNTKERKDFNELLLSSQSKSDSKSTSLYLSFTGSELNINSPLKNSSAEVSIDLTQNDEDEEGDLILSDDEINYSIWKANKTSNFREQSEMPIEAQDLTLSGDSAQETSLILSNQHEYSFLDLIDANKSCHAEEDNSILKQITSTLSFEGDVELISSQFLATPSKSPNISASKRKDLVEERAEFGILESCSESFTQSPTFKTPTKLPPLLANVDDDLANASFLQSPSEYCTAPLKRYSTNSQKFNDLLQSVQNKMNNSGDDSDEQDEFDKLVFGSPPAKQLKSTVNRNEPIGLEQLLNAEISFREEEISDYRTPKKLYISPSKSKFNISQKRANKLTETNNEEEELQINDRVYRVRLCTTEKPDFTKQSEAELLKQLYSFGIKPLKRKQAVKILEYIYNQTHPLMVALDQEEKKQEQEENPTTSKHRKNSGAVDFSSQTIISSQPATQLSVVSSGTALASKKLNLCDCFGAVLMRFSHELCAELCEESEEYVFQTNVSKKVPQPLLPLHIAWYNLVCANPTLHETILMFEPIDLQDVYLFLKGLGYRYNPKDLKIFFDRRCIIFRYDLTAPNVGKQTSGTTANNRHVRKRKNKVVKQIV